MRLKRIRPKTTRLKTTRLEALVLADEGGNAVEKSRLADHADEGNRKTCSARMIPNLSAIVQCAIGVGNRGFGKREQPRLRQILLLPICQHDDRNARRDCRD